MPEEFDPAYWEARYHGHAAHGSRAPHARLVAETGQLPPGTALDGGCGEGGTALWLAERGWRVTAVDISPTALRRARQHAQSQGGDAAGIEWVEADLMVWEPPGKHFDLVTALYVHPAGSRQQLIRRLAAAVAPGGTLFAVEHGHSDEHARTHASADQLAAALDPREWEIEAGETRERRDVVLCARRRP